MSYVIVRRHLLSVFCVAIALIKIALVLHSDIAATYRPHDDLLYLKSSEILYWGRSTEPFFSRYLPVFKPPAFPLWIAATERAIPIPFQLTNELFFLFCAFLFSRAVSRLLEKSAISVPIFFLMVFHPVVFNVFQTVSVDTFFVSVWMIYLVLMIDQLMIGPLRPGWSVGRAVLAGLIAAILFETRQDDFQVIFAVLCPAFVQVLRRSLPLKTLGAAIKSAPWKSAGIQLLVVAAVMVLVSGLNLARYGVFADRGTRLKGPWSLMQSLASLESNQGVRFAGVRAASFDAAAPFSPTLTSLMPLVHGSLGKLWKDLARFHGAPEGEFGGGMDFFLWDLTYAAHVEGVKAKNDILLKASEEVRTACKSGHLKCRKSFSLFWPVSGVEVRDFFQAESFVMNKIIFPAEYVDLSHTASQEPEAVRAYERLKKNWKWFYSNSRISKSTLELFTLLYRIIFCFSTVLALVGGTIFMLTRFSRGLVFPAAFTEALMIFLILIFTRAGVLIYMVTFLSDTIEDRYLLPIFSLVVALFALLVSAFWLEQKLVLAENRSTVEKG